MQTILFEDMVKVMERGQVTIPLKLREFFNMQKGLRLWIRVDQNNKITLEPVKEDKKIKLKSFLEKATKDTYVYWNKEDDKNLTMVRKKTMERVKSLQW
ncbi:hypothetical protein COW57_04285 [Candidatus Roizmanbacteria bacterium CG17_big_fil_post_rev_8_21_14_2_50_39_7]|uniref:SpoVT-AbrB domain-containing protein n=1 Tax=Candidatus Roizmanbacteria bacterium CG17_big_fil_post_rev_8_21_14_2_50_39_7 TaxID=1974858 RepID=A0A2M7EJ75_9BACT|nr:MAG: hypothetical protein COW57_04285 [Candidatus Roizmanbacteria bacterium CG17_big_fil_post_rev_8_21_14_2_50_39_7]